MADKTPVPVPGTDIKLYDISGWSRSTIADGKWLNNNTIQPLEDNEYILASAIQGVSDEVDLIKAQSDVADVVGTYQDLVDYEYPLTDRDIVKVLHDENCDSGQSYWRVVGGEPGSYEWSFIGEISDQSDWTQQDPANPEYIKNKPSEINIVAGPNVDLYENDNHELEISAAPTQVQSDWTESDSGAKSYIQHKPDLDQYRDVFIGSYHTTPYADLVSAIDAGKLVFIDGLTMRMQFIRKNTNPDFLTFGTIGPYNMLDPSSDRTYSMIRSICTVDSNDNWEYKVGTWLSPADNSIQFDWKDGEICTREQTTTARCYRPDSSVGTEFLVSTLDIEFPTPTSSGPNSFIYAPTALHVLFEITSETDGDSRKATSNTAELDLYMLPVVTKVSGEQNGFDKLYGKLISHCDPSLTKITDVTLFAKFDGDNLHCDLYANVKADKNDDVGEIIVAKATVNSGYMHNQSWSYINSVREPWLFKGLSSFGNSPTGTFDAIKMIKAVEDSFLIDTDKTIKFDNRYGIDDVYEEIRGNSGNVFSYIPYESPRTVYNLSIADDLVGGGTISLSVEGDKDYNPEYMPTVQRDTDSGETALYITFPTKVVCKFNDFTNVKLYQPPYELIDTTDIPVALESMTVYENISEKHFIPAVLDSTVQITKPMTKLYSEFYYGNAYEEELLIDGIFLQVNVSDLIMRKPYSVHFLPLKATIEAGYNYGYRKNTAKFRIFNDTGVTLKLLKYDTFLDLTSGTGTATDWCDVHPANWSGRDKIANIVRTSPTTISVMEGTETT